MTDGLKSEVACAKCTLDHRYHGSITPVYHHLRPPSPPAPSISAMNAYISLLVSFYFMADLCKALGATTGHGQSDKDLFSLHSLVSICGHCMAGYILICMEDL